MRRKQPTTSLDGVKMPRLLTEEQAAAYLGLSLSYLRKGRCRTTRRGTPPPQHIRVDGRVLYPTKTLDAWVDGLIAAREAI